MTIDIRLERPEDYQETENVTREAFWNHFVPGCNEHYLLHTMRDDAAFLPELDFVAVHDGSIVGNVALAKGIIKGDDGTDYDVLTLGPIAVLPDFQGQGIGGALIDHVKEEARAGGHRAIVLTGDPAYYSRHGFIPAEDRGIRMADNMYAAALQVCELYDNALESAQGRYVEGAIYEVDEAAAEEFDQRFPEKEKTSGSPSQKRFEELVTMRRSADEPA